MDNSKEKMSHIGKKNYEEVVNKIYIPYRFINIYKRGAMMKRFFLIFFSLIFLFSAGALNGRI